MSHSGSVRLFTLQRFVRGPLLDTGICTGSGAAEAPPRGSRDCVNGRPFRRTAHDSSDSHRK